MKKVVKGLLFLAMSFSLCLIISPKAEAASNRYVYIEQGTIYDPNVVDTYTDDYETGDFLFIGDTGKIQLNFWMYEDQIRLDHAEYASTDPSVISVDAEGNIKALKGGRSFLSAKGYDAEGNMIFEGYSLYRVCSDVSSAQLSKSKVSIPCVYGETEDVVISLKNCPDLMYHTFSYTNSNNKMSAYCDLDAQKKQVTLHVYGTGTTTISLTINQYTFKIKFTIKEAYINKVSAVTYAKKSVKLKIKGYTGKVTWKSMNKKIATVTKAGVVKPKKKGSTIIYAVAGKYRMGCCVSVVSKKMKKVISTANHIYKTSKYSQAKRMQKGYYDCSSLVWRSYKSAGLNVASSSYAPTAADMAKYLMSHQKRIKGGASVKNIRKMKLKPGDLAFLTGNDNKRYKGIYHVEMFVGYACTGFSGKTPYITTVWATRPGGYYWGNCMARPFNK